MTHYLEIAERFRRSHPAAAPFIPPSRENGESDASYEKRLTKAIVDWQIAVLREEDRPRGR